MIRKIIIIAFILLIPFQDTGLQKNLRFLGSSIAFIPIVLLVFGDILQFLWTGNRKINRTYLVGTIYIIALSGLYLLMFGYDSHGRSTIVKSLNLYVLTFLFIYPMLSVDFAGKYVSRAVKLSFLITLSGVLLGDILHLPLILNNTFIHFHPNLNLRPRGFESEASVLGAMSISLGLLSMHYSKRVGKCIFLALMIVTTVISGSKGGLVGIGVVLLVLLLSSRKKYWIILGLPVLAAGLTILYGIIDKSLQTDITNYTSTATRLGLIVTTLLIVEHNPFGVGFAGFLHAINVYVPKAINLLAGSSVAVNVPFNFTELARYVSSSSDLDVSTKTFLFDNLAFFGLPFLIVIVRFHRRILRGLHGRPELLAGIVYSVVALSTYVGGLGLYNFSLLYGVVVSEIRRNEHPDSGS